MVRRYILAGGSFALMAVVLGAFTSHFLKDHFTEEVLQSFQTGIRYMMYHGLALIIFSQIPNAKNPLIFKLFFWGVILFSFSIFILCFGKLTTYDFSWLGPITPMGGSLLILGWVILLLKTFKEKSQ